MPHLYEALTWTIDEPDRPLEFVFHNDGEVLAKATRVAPPRQGDAAMPYANPHGQADDSRLMLCVAGADGTPYFYVDHTRDPMVTSPSFVVSPDGGLIGSVAVKRGGLKEAFTLFRGRGEVRMVIQDADRQPVAMMTTPLDPTVDGRLTDARGGAELGRYRERALDGGRRRRRVMRLNQALPEPARTLVLGSLIGVELMVPR
ncbi:hypothetical protein [Actinomadura rudentiformis]|uniref:Uncharacterized protein n=1 Tax=Actinomadura rudentiformis TaxID=359158 RepID=A0A6H9YM91_9ACTN|nr:hypothetical protein [Actinomadura rudentiformis]KAB2347822.1 hypothetical protein F8566_18185 [Actinomadura rudentiformis]